MDLIGVVASLFPHDKHGGDLLYRRGIKLTGQVGKELFEVVLVRDKGMLRITLLKFEVI